MYTAYFGEKKKKTHQALQDLGSQHKLKGLGKAMKRQERGGIVKTKTLVGAAWGTILALREIWWCRNDIFRAAGKVMDEYLMLSITPWEKLMKPKQQQKYKCKNMRKKT